MSSRLREPTEQELRDLAMTLAGEIDQRRSPITDPQTRVEAANILATVVNRFSTDEPMRFGRSQVRSYDTYSDVVRNAGQYNAWMGQHVGTTRQNYDANQDFWDGAVRDFFSGELKPTAPNATHYHADFVSPSWARAYDQVAQAGPHVFYSDESYMGRPLGERRPSYAMAAPSIGSSRQREGQPNPATDFNAQELAEIAPQLPATPAQMRAAMTPSVPNPTARPDWLSSAPTPGPTQGAPMQERTIGGYVGQQMGVPADQVVAGLMAPGASARAIRGASGLTPETQQRLASVAGMLPADNQPQITSTVRDDRFRTHAYGGAIDLRNRDRTPFQEAQQVAALARAGFEAIGPYNNASGMPAHIHVGDDTRFNRLGSVFQASARQDNPYLSGTQPNSGLYDAVDSGSRVSDAWFGPTAPNPTRNVQPRNMGDGSLDAIPGITPAPDRRDMALPVTAPNSPTRATPQTAAFSSMDAARAAPVTPVTRATLPAPSPSTSTVADAYRQMAASRTPSPTSRRVDQGFASANRAPSQASFPLASSRSPTDFQYAARPTPTMTPSPQASSRINQAFNTALSPRSIPSPIGRVSQPGSFGTPAPRRSPTDFQYSSAPRPAPQSPVPTPRAPQQPSMGTMVDQYGMRALQARDPFAAAPVPSIVPGPVAPRPQFGAVPNPMARPANIGPRVGRVAAPVPRSRARSVPNPVAAPRSQNILEAVGFNNWAQGLMNAPRMIGNAFASPMQAINNAFGNNQPMDISPPRQMFRQGSNLPTGNTPNWQDNTGLPTWASVTGGYGGTGASAHDAFADSLGSAFY